MESPGRAHRRGAADRDADPFAAPNVPERPPPSPGPARAPAGAPLANVSLADCASRATEEATGTRPAGVTHVLDFYPSPGSADMKGHLFIARGLVESDRPRDPDEPTEPFLVQHDQAIELIRQGQIQEAATVMAILILDRPELTPQA